MSNTNFRGHRVTKVYYGGSYKRLKICFLAQLFCMLIQTAAIAESTMPTKTLRCRYFGILFCISYYLPSNSLCPNLSAISFRSIMYFLFDRLLQYFLNTSSFLQWHNFERWEIFLSIYFFNSKFNYYLEYFSRE